MELKAIGNEYNILLPAQGSTTIDFLPDGKYEICCHYDIDFSKFNYEYTDDDTEGEAVLTKENGKYYLTLTSKEKTTTGDITHNSTIDFWRGYVDDENDIPKYYTSAKYSEKNSWLGTDRNGFNVETNLDEENPDNFYNDYVDDNYITP